MSLPALGPALALAAGAVAGVFLPAILPGPVAGGLLLGGWVAALVAYRRGRARLFLASSLGTLVVVGGVLAAAANAAATESSLASYFETGIRDANTDAPDGELFRIVEGVLRSDAGRRPWGASLDLDVVSVTSTAPEASKALPVSVTGGLRATVGGELAAGHLREWRAGRRVRIAVGLRQPREHWNGGGADERQAMAWRGTVLTGRVKSALLVEVVARGSWLDEWAAAARAAVRTALERTVGHWSRTSAAIATALLIGDRAGLDAALLERLRRAGTYHVIAISGGNVAIFVLLTLGALREARVGRRTATLLAMMALLAYASVVGPQPSVTRAVLMAFIYLGARLLDHRTHPLNTLAVAAGGAVIATPLTVADPGFALTIGATAAILTGAETVARRLTAHPRLAAPATLLAASVCAELAVFPVTARAFSQVTFAGLLLNFLAVPLMSVCQIAAMGALALAVVPGPAAVLVGWVAHMGAWGLTASAGLADWAPWLAYRVPPPTLWTIALYYIGLILGIAWRPRVPGARRVRVGVGLVTVVAAWSIVTEPAWAMRDWWGGRGDRLRVTFLDVGQGDATLVQFPNHHAWLVDTGGGSEAFDLGSQVVVPAVWATGVRRLDGLVLTHGDPDHAGGARAVLRDLSPSMVWEGVPVPSDPGLSALRAAATRQGAAWRQLRRGERMIEGGVEIYVWHPPSPDWERQQVRNDDSVVLELRYGQVSVVLPGDIGRDVEREIGGLFEPVPLRVLKAAHHGSGTSSAAAFLEALRPALVVFSSGRGNQYGHPVAAVRRRVRQAGALIFRTDRDGAVRLETDGTHVHIVTRQGRQLSLGAAP